MLVELAVGAGRLQVPVARQGVLRLQEGGLVEDVPVGPVGRGRGRARIADRRAVRILQRQRAPQHPVGLAFVPREAAGQGQVGGHVPGEDAVGQGPLGGVIVEVGVGLLAGQDDAPAHRARGVQRPREIRLQPLQVPGADLGGEIALELGGRPLAHVVDGRRRIADAGHQRVGAAHHLDAVEHRGVHLAELDVPDQRQADAVQLEVGDVEAAGVVLGAVGLDLLDVDARRLGQQVLHLGQAEVADLLRGDDRHRLRGLAQRHRQAGDRGHGLLRRSRHHHLVDHLAGRFGGLFGVGRPADRCGGRGEKRELVETGGHVRPENANDSQMH